MVRRSTDENTVTCLSLSLLSSATDQTHSIVADWRQTDLRQAFISGRLDYCNSLLYGMTDSLF